MTPPRFPANLGEIFRAAGRSVDRYPGLEWMEEYVERIAERLLDIWNAPHDAAPEGETPLTLMERSAEVLQRGNAAVMRHTSNTRHARWVLMDAWARAKLRQVTHGVALDWIESVTANDTDTNDDVLA